MAKGTELVFILDKSGSMAGLEADTIGGYNSLLQKQQAKGGNARVTTVLFDNGYTLLHDRIELAAVSPITPRQYCVGGSTALLDAMGLTIEKIAAAQKHTAPAYRAKQVLFVITTDGMENASRTYTLQKINALVKKQQRKYGWEFLFLGANMDAVSVAGSFGIPQSRAQTYHADSAGTRLNFEATAQAVACFCQRGEITEDWADEIKQDYQRRGKKPTNP